jgi:hypothetical protein
VTAFTLETLVGLHRLDRPGVRWRHDVDYDPACAVQMAELEQQAGVRSVFCIRLRGPYNPFSDDTAEMLHRIVACGHTLGVHVDLGLPRHAATPVGLLAEAAERDYTLLAAEHPVERFVSFHAPPADIYGRRVPGFAHAFEDPWQRRTVSDSRGVWHGDPVQLLASGQPATLSLHPEWWFWQTETAEMWRQLEAAKP